jgi:hypothetical protein
VARHDCYADVCAAAEPQDKPKAPEPRNLVSGGLPGMGIARDLMYVDFTVPKEVHKNEHAVAAVRRKQGTLC